MTITAIILAAVVVGGTGLFIGFSWNRRKKFAVEVDEREEAILGPSGNNYGGCGYAPDVSDLQQQS